MDKVNTLTFWHFAAAAVALRRVQNRTQENVLIAAEKLGKQ